MRYVALNCAVLLGLVVAVWFTRRRARAWVRTAAITTGLLLLLTLVFDNLIIWAGIVAYDPQRILGVTAWLAPIEDFAYSIGAVLIVGLLWEDGEQHAEHS
jgi:lycopene cyclase domain-containing protein